MSENTSDFASDEEFQKWRAEHEASSAGISEDAVQRMIDQALERQREQHNAEMEALQNRLTTVQGQLPQTLIPEHAGGFGVDSIASSWSQYDQELARAGNHPFAKGESADWLEHPDDVQTVSGRRTRKSTATEG